MKLCLQVGFVAFTLIACRPALAADDGYSSGILDAITGRRLQVSPADDVDRNGVPDNPFLTLQGSGEIWMSTVESENDVCTVIAQRWNGAHRSNEPTMLIDVEVQRKGGSQRLSVEIPYALASPGESAVALVSIATSLNGLVGPEEAERFAEFAADVVQVAAQFIEVSVIVSDDGGATYSKLDEARLKSQPIRLVLGDLALASAIKPILLAHPSYVESDGVSGLWFRADEGGWELVDSKTAVDAAKGSSHVPSGTMEATLDRLSLFAPVLMKPEALVTPSVIGEDSDSAIQLSTTGVPETSQSTGTTEDSGRVMNHLLGGPRGGPVDTVWVDFDYLGLEDGSELMPFNRFLEGVFIVPSLGTINLKPGISNEAFTVSKAMTITSIGGTARIGVLDATRDVTINEFVPTNLTGLEDEDNSTQDWIEVFNSGVSSISLDGWGLSNDTSLPYKWTFPNVDIAPGEYLVVFASGKNRKPTDGSNLHTNFTLASSGDLVLTTSVAEPISPTRLEDYSTVANNKALAYFQEGPGGAFDETNNPTPGEENVEHGPVVILDPGHGTGTAGDSATTGQSSTGTTGIVSGVPEFEGVFLVAEQVRDRIAVLDDSVEVIITKPNDTTNISNLDRARQLGDNSADLFVSLHFDGAVNNARKTFGIVLPVMFQETIGGVLFKTNNRNQQAEIDFANQIVDRIVAAFTIFSGDAPVDGGVISTGTTSNKGVLFETTADWVANVGPNGELWEERLYHSEPSTSSRGLAVLIEIDNYLNLSVDDHLNDPVAEEPFPPAYQPISNAIASAIVDKLNE